MGPIQAFLEADHRRLDALLLRCVRADGSLETATFEAFREGLLRHIRMEERGVLLAARTVRAGAPLPIARQLRVEHGAIASLLVPTPDVALVSELRGLLAHHNTLEEGAAGVYAECDEILGPERAAAVVEQLKATPPVRVAAHYDGPGTVRTAAEALAISSRQSPVA